MERTHRPILALGLAGLLLGILVGLTIPASAVHGGAPPGRPTNLAWHDGQMWNSVVLGPLHGRAPAHTLDAFYVFPGVQAPVAGAGPGDSDYNGGRWIPFVCTGGGAYTDGDQVEADILSAAITCTPNMGGPFAGQNFLCPLTNRNN